MFAREQLWTSEIIFFYLLIILRRDFVRNRFLRRFVILDKAVQERVYLTLR
jgi:hypothetical protein